MNVCYTKTINNNNIPGVIPQVGCLGRVVYAAIPLPCEGTKACRNRPNLIIMDRGMIKTAKMSLDFSLCCNYLKLVGRRIECNLCAFFKSVKYCYLLRRLPLGDTVIPLSYCYI